MRLEICEAGDFEGLRGESIRFTSSVYYFTPSASKEADLQTDPTEVGPVCGGGLPPFFAPYPYDQLELHIFLPSSNSFLEVRGAQMLFAFIGQQGGKAQSCILNRQNVLVERYHQKMLAENLPYRGVSQLSPWT